MAKKAPSIADFMTASPVTVGSQQSFDSARNLMKEHNVRHLPVLEGNKLVGVISDRDLALLEGYTHSDASTLVVEDAMTQDVYIANRDTTLAEVVKSMHARKLGSAVVVDNNNGVIGIFTAIDAMYALLQIIESA